MISKSRMSKMLNRVRTWAGNTFTLDGGQAIICSTASAEDRDLKYLPDGHRNAINSDLRVFAFDPAQAQSIVTEGVSGTWNANGVRYTIISAYLTSNGTSWRTIAYREPRIGSDPDNPSNANGAWGPS